MLVNPSSNRSEELKEKTHGYRNKKIEKKIVTFFLSNHHNNRFFSGGGGDRRLRPHHHHQALKCPHCDSLNTKFCYYNNYHLSQPRHFCKTCRRYWTKGGGLRNVPVGGGCRKSKHSNNNSSFETETTTAPTEHNSNSHSSSESSSLTLTTEAVVVVAAEGERRNYDYLHSKGLEKGLGIDVYLL
ncbi:unnamed protein product [Lupinus luteus]|uniref:Dof zinc finger protein n=1 Tax=Lupinus luteus TaxID=3873 RepID=A0AAV1XDS7_LUPLU